MAGVTFLEEIFCKNITCITLMYIEHIEISNTFMFLINVESLHTSRFP